MANNPNEQPSPPIAKFESMLKTDDVYFLMLRILKTSFTTT